MTDLDAVAKRHADALVGRAVLTTCVRATGNDTVPRTRSLDKPALVRLLGYRLDRFTTWDDKPCVVVVWDHVDVLAHPASERDRRVSMRAVAIEDKTFYAISNGSYFSMGGGLLVQAEATVRSMIAEAAPTAAPEPVFPPDAELFTL